MGGPIYHERWQDRPSIKSGDPEYTDDQATSAAAANKVVRYVEAQSNEIFAISFKVLPHVFFVESDRTSIDKFLTVMESNRQKVNDSDLTFEFLMEDKKIPRMMPIPLKKRQARQDAIIESTSADTCCNTVNGQDFTRDLVVENLTLAFCTLQEQEMECLSRPNVEPEDVSNRDVEKLAIEPKREYLNAELAQVKRDYERIAFRREKVISFPARCSMAHHLPALKEEDKTESSPVSNEFFKLQEEMLASKTRSTAKKMKAFNQEIKTVFSHVVRNSETIGTSYVNAMHPTIRGNFKPTVVINEEAKLSFKCPSWVGSSARKSPFHREDRMQHFVTQPKPEETAEAQHMNKKCNGNAARYALEIAAIEYDRPARRDKVFRNPKETVIHTVIEKSRDPNNQCFAKIDPNGEDEECYSIVRSILERTHTTAFRDLGQESKQELKNLEARSKRPREDNGETSNVVPILHAEPNHHAKVFGSASSI